jgi:hypothetical protein
MANDECRWVFVSTADLRDIGKPDRAPTGDDRGIGDCLQTVIGAVESNEDLRPRVSMEPAGVTVFWRCKAVAMFCADTPSVASLAKENSTNICSGRSSRMLIFLTPGTCRRPWRMTSARRTNSRMGMPLAFSA